MKQLLSTLILSFVLVFVHASAAVAAKAPASNEPVGYDISWPQCGKKLPTNQAFGVIGVNGGTAANTNPCLSDQLLWAKKSSGVTAQDSIQLYVNTANPGEVISQITTWPTSNNDKTGFTTANPYGICKGSNDLPCSWQYGWNRALEATLDRFAPAAKKAGIDPLASSYIWWLDVETGNTWQSGSTDALNRNVAALDGMADYFYEHNVTIGLYSTADQWRTITGNYISSTSNLNGIANWRPSGATLSNAINNCGVDPLTPGGFISLTQYVQQGLDKNHSCL